ncbi:hypothetical protein CK203_042180 [Vitis vinifera]|uniref:Uncharacterized protein n=1 Tax=Vitis vinifera TaxID=29760 RepID=A0A438HPV8_VITVI|nr:hypothetical protein CK203_042180 [Vitis vinifera]
MGRRRNSSVNVLFGWVRRQSMKVKAFLAVTSVLSSLLALKFLVKDRNHFFVASEAIHVVGIMVLIYKLTTQKTCSGNSFLFFWGHGDRKGNLDFLFLYMALFVSWGNLFMIDLVGFVPISSVSKVFSFAILSPNQILVSVFPW